MRCRSLRRVVLLAMLCVQCRAGDEPRRDATRADAGALATSASARPAAPSRAAAGLPELLYLPDSGDVAFGEPAPVQLLPPPWRANSRRCPPEMVDVRGLFCIDRFEASLVDQRSGRVLSPYYHPTPSQLSRSYASWQKRRFDTGLRAARDMPVPPPPAWQLEEEFTPSARSQPNAVPSGYLSGELAHLACRNAGKRLCTLDEWQLACRGERASKFPYGDEFVPGKCNVARDAHPAAILHGNASIHHLDPRLNLVADRGEPLLHRTGEMRECKSSWRDDAVFDMVGNLDEWVEDPHGTFAGGFFSRATREGCDSRITSHDFSYFDYSLGVRCCR